MTPKIPVHNAHALPEKMTVFITGVASGIGLAQAKAFLQKGHNVYGIDCQVGEVEALSAQYPQTFGFSQADVTQVNDVERAVTECVARYGSVQVLCNTAGVLDHFATLEQTTRDMWQRILDVNVTGMFNVTQALLPYLLQQPTSRVINMASIASLTAGGGGIAYTTAKHAVAGFTKQLAYDYSKKGLRSNAIAPGAIQTAMTQMDFEQDNGKMAQWVANQVPIGRWAQADEVAQLTLFLASDASDYMQGNIIPLDGGWMIR
ncbi:MAG: 3-oxoacyl-ACP reductase [Aerococcaceae bacterium]|nr:3-oxoacyl-ACP reductase [Aerococcaceae bacterium]